MNKYRKSSRVKESRTCWRKVRYTSRRSADAERLTRKVPGSSYNCKFCNGWHISKRRPRPFALFGTETERPPAPVKQIVRDGKVLMPQRFKEIKPQASLAAPAFASLASRPERDLRSTSSPPIDLAARNRTKDLASAQAADQ